MSVDHTGRCVQMRVVILRGHVVPVDSLLDGTARSGNNSLHSRLGCMRNGIADLFPNYIVPLHCIHGLEHHTLEEGVPRIIITSFCDRTGSPLNYFASHTKSLTYREVPDKRVSKVRRVLMPGTSGIMLPRFHSSSLRSISMVSSSTRAY